MGVPMVHWLPDYRVFEGGGDGRESEPKGRRELKEKRWRVVDRARRKNQAKEKDSRQWLPR